jgi:hypothetical protein
MRYVNNPNSSFHTIDRAQVCINQGDDYEKGHQVRMMAQIYQEAKHVTVWLGKEDTYSAFAMESFQTIYKSKHFSSLSAIAASDDSIGEPRLRRLNSGLNALLKEFDLFNILAAAWHTLSPREWWSRLWVIQEVALAKQAYLKCGSSQLSWTVFRSIVLICDWLLECKPRHRDSNKLARLRNLAMMTLDCSQNVRLERSMSLLYLLGVLSSTSTTQQRTSDHRDRIYALLGMASDVAYLNVEPEYNLHWIKVYTETTIALLKAHGPMILSYCVPADEHRRHPDLPSWVPDWRRMIRHPLQGWDASFNYKACGSPRNDLPTASISPAKILSIRGAVFDQVSFVGQTPRGNRFSVLESREDITIAISNFKREYIRRTEDTKHATWRPSTKRYEEEALWRAPAANQILRAGTEGPCYSAETEDAIGYNALLESGANAFASNEPRILDYCWSIWRIMRGRRLFASARGYIGIASRQITPRDVICVLLGADVPFILRENSKGLFKFIGEAYVHGVMDGEFMDSNPEIRTFDIE